jgi:hypothetical protein
MRNPPIEIRVFDTVTGRDREGVGNTASPLQNTSSDAGPPSKDKLTKQSISVINQVRDADMTQPQDLHLPLTIITIFSTS